MTLGTMATDVERRIDFDELRAYRLGRARAQLEKNGYGSFLCFDLDNIRYITGTALAEWTRGKWVRWCLLTPEGLTFASPKTLGATWYVGLDYGPAIRAILYEPPRLGMSSSRTRPKRSPSPSMMCIPICSSEKPLSSSLLRKCNLPMETTW